MLKLGCCTYNFRSWGLEQSLQFIRNLNFTHASVGAFDRLSQVNPLHAAAEPIKMGQMIRDTADKYELALVELFVCSVWIDEQKRISPSHPNETLRNKMLRQFQSLCQCAKEAGLMNVMGVPGDLKDALNLEDGWEASVLTLRQMIEIAGEVGIGFSVEPHKGSIITSMETARQLLKDVPGLRYSLDYAQLLSQNIPLEDMISLHSDSVHVHLKPAKPGIGKCLIAEDEMDYAMIIKDLEARSWGGVMCIECIYDTNVLSFEKHPAFQSSLLTYELERIMGSERIERS